MQISVSSKPFIAGNSLPSDAPTIKAQTSEAPKNIIFDFFRPNTLPSQNNRPAILNFSALPDKNQYQKAISTIQDRVNTDLDLQNTWTDQKIHLRKNYQSLFQLNVPMN